LKLYHSSAVFFSLNLSGKERHGEAVSPRKGSSVLRSVNQPFMEPLINVHQVKKSFSFLFVVSQTKFLTDT